MSQVCGRIMDLLNVKQQTKYASAYFESGTSERHLMIYIMFKSTYTKQEPNVLRKR